MFIVSVAVVPAQTLPPLAPLPVALQLPSPRL
jgi:hypothetical protein